MYFVNRSTTDWSSFLHRNASSYCASILILNNEMLLIYWFSQIHEKLSVHD